MKSILKSVCRYWVDEAEAGQAMIMFAVMSSALFMTLGLAVEGGNLLSQYRQLQSNADMAAIVGAQKLPCSTSACITTAQQTACTNVTTNDPSLTCTPGSRTAPSAANVPPVSCSPYDFIDYGNGSGDATYGDSSCKAGTSPSQYTYIEVQLRKSLGTIPIFNVPVTVGAHAVARTGARGAGDYAILLLDPSKTGALTINGSNNVSVVGSVAIDSTASWSMIFNGPNSVLTCDGGWYNASGQAASSPVLTSLKTNTGGTPGYAGPACTGGAADNPASYSPSLPTVQDPYANSTIPTGNMANCQACNQNGFAYCRSSSNNCFFWKWQQASASPLVINGDGVFELFPGIYPGGIIINGSNLKIYFNPGVYTLGADLTNNGSGNQLCIYGAPACDNKVGSGAGNSNANCSNVSFNSGDTTYVSSAQWYYYCSPWGIYDKYLSRTGAPSGGPSTTVPTFSDGTTPLNGVTFYMETGNLTMNGGISAVLAAPNACPGTGSPGTGSIPWPAGAATGSYTYPSGSLPNTGGVNTSPISPTSPLYGSDDLTVAGECKNGLTTWTGEFGSGTQGQHVQFAVFARNTSTQVTLNGQNNQNWWGDIYNPGVSGTGGTVVLNGSNGSTGPPLVSGQVIGDSATINGGNNVDVYYRPCIGSAPCGSAPGTSLIE